MLNLCPPVHHSQSDLTMKLWDFRQMVEIQTIEGFDEPVMSASWSYSGGMISVATRDGNLRYYDPRHSGKAAGVCFRLFGFLFFLSFSA